MMQLRKIKVLTFFFLSFVCSQTTVYGQMISGKIIDAEQLPIDGATIILDVYKRQVYARVSPKKLFEDMDKFIKATEDFKLTL